jgi:hypothetical protein
MESTDREKRLKYLLRLFGSLRSHYYHCEVIDPERKQSENYRGNYKIAIPRKSLRKYFGNTAKVTLSP